MTQQRSKPKIPRSAPADARRQLRAARREVGDTLIEILIAMLILSLSMVAILGALTTTLSSSGEHRSLAADDTLVSAMAEQVKNIVELQTVPDWPGGSSGDCPASGSLTEWYDTAANIPLPASLTGGGNYPITLSDAPYTGYIVNLTNAEYWNGSAWQSTCPVTATGVEKVTVEVTSLSKVPDTMDVVVRKQSDGSA